MRFIKHKLTKSLFIALLLLLPVLSVVPAAAESQCGKGDGAVETSINFGCKGDNCTADNCGAGIDAAFAIIRFLSAGVGLAVVASLVYAGIQYIGSRGDPTAVQLAQERIRNTLIALIIFIFSYAILNYIIPTGFFSL